MGGKSWTDIGPGTVLGWTTRNVNMHGMGMARVNHNKCLVTGRNPDGTFEAVNVIDPSSLAVRRGVPGIALAGQGLDGFYAVPAEKWSFSEDGYRSRGMLVSGVVSPETLDAVRGAMAQKPKSAFEKMREHLDNENDREGDRGGDPHGGPEI